MRLIDLIQTIDSACERLKLQYYVTGSVASSFYGEFRSTLDVDIVIEIASWLVHEFCAQFPEPDWYVSEEAAKTAVQHGGMFNILHSTSGLKIDVCLPKDTPFAELCFDHKRRVSLEEGVQVWMSSPEDIILNKLLFYREGRSEKHVRDIGGIYKSGRDHLDLPYIEHWSLRIGVGSEWAAVKSKHGIH